MELTIKNKNDQEVIVSFGREKLSVNIGEDAFENNTNWNTTAINKFLILLASSLDKDDTIEVVSDESDNASYQHIVELFAAFAKEYNKD